MTVADMIDDLLTLQLNRPDKKIDQAAYDTALAEEAKQEQMIADALLFYECAAVWYAKSFAAVTPPRTGRLIVQKVRDASMLEWPPRDGGKPAEKAAGYIPRKETEG